MYEANLPPPTIPDLLHWRALHDPLREAYTFLLDGEAKKVHMTYADLDREARRIAALLQDCTSVGDRALLLYPPGLEYVAAIFGCFYAGVVAVPAYPPRLNQSLKRIQTILQDAQITVALTTGKILSSVHRMLVSDQHMAHIHWIATDTSDQETGKSYQESRLDPSALALLQYTSGSTGSPKGVMLTHENIMQNAALIQEGMGLSSKDRGLFWLPPYHDMGLMAGILQTLFTDPDRPTALMAPATFLQQPLRWLRAISSFQATISGGPNFAYDLCVKSAAEETIKALDLSCWAIAFTGAEPVRAETLERFAQTFAPCGFRPKAFYPCYGLAEATLFVSGGHRLDQSRIRTFEKGALETGYAIEARGDEGSRLLVSCGSVRRDQEVTIVDPEHRTRLADGSIGEIWVRGPNVGQGYWGQEKATAETFQAFLRGDDSDRRDGDSPPSVSPDRRDSGSPLSLCEDEQGPFLRTGDLGFCVNGELYITGRIKDLVIIRGRNLHPQDIEQVVEACHVQLRPGCGVAFSVEGQALGLSESSGEQLVVLQEVGRHCDEAVTQEVIGVIRQAVLSAFEVEMAALALLRAGAILKTSSGKIQRQACRSAFLAGELKTIAHWTCSEMRSGKGVVEADGRVQNQDEKRQDQKEMRNSGRLDVSQHALSVQTAKQALTPNRQEIIDWLTAHIAERAHIGRDEIDVSAPFVQFGLNSLDAIGLSGELERWLGRSLSPTLVYDYPSIVALAHYLAGEARQGEVSGRQEPLRSGPAFEQSQEPTSRKESDAIAIIGLGCRFPGAENPEAFWQMLHDGIDGVSEVPASRFDAEQFYARDQATPGKMNTRWGGFLSHIEQFDCAFFALSPREAAQMDPQQRLLLEVAWETLENAGQAADRLSGSQTGVFIGISSDDYSRMPRQDRAQINAYTGTGNAHSIAANRLSYTFDLRGPSMAIDTACSSSLVAVHQACLSLRHGECDLALAGGVNVILAPELTITFSQARMMSSDGRCRTFDAAADGYVRSEGCGLVLLKPLAQALHDGDRVLAIIRGSAINQDGRSNGLVAPNGPSQEAVIRHALQHAGVHPSEVSYVETHGSSTSLGDPIEVDALKAVFMQERSSDQPCLLGAVKTNIGHLEAAAGIAGLIKTVLCLQKGVIAPNLHFKTLNPHISFAGTTFEILTEPRQWPPHAQRFAGVSAFGFGGTNAHVILEGAERRDSASRLSERPLHLLTLSGRTAQALPVLAQRYQDFLVSHPTVSLADLCGTSQSGRTHFAHRLAVWASNVEQMRERLSAFAAGQSPKGLLVGQAQRPPAVAFLFTGQGSQYVHMGHQLYETQPTFRQALDECNRLLSSFLPQPVGQALDLLSVLYPTSGATSPLNETAYAQPALFALEYALAQMWLSWGVKPDVVMGHSVGEYVAACIAGAFGLSDGLKLITLRGRLMQSLPEQGKMAMILAKPEWVQSFIAPYAGQVSIAALNGPNNTVISGREEVVQLIVHRLETAGVRTHALATSHAFHSPLMEPMLDAFEQVASEVAFAPLCLPLVCNLTGQLIHVGETLDAHYWRCQTREAVQFATGIQTLAAHGYELFLELGPTPVLSHLGKRCLPEHSVTWLSSLREAHDDWHILMQSIASLYCKGHKLNQFSFAGSSQSRKIALPTYPFEREYCWFESEETDKRSVGTGLEPRTIPTASVRKGVPATASRTEASPVPTRSSGDLEGKSLIDFSLIFFSSDEACADDEIYRLVIESARYADQHGFSSVWIPERHFTKEGWLYPNPVALTAALARETNRIHLRAGSVVVPLHHPLRIAEDWAMVDHLSGGRVGISFASGWHPNDFSLAPENYADRSAITYRNIEIVRKLWRGETVPFQGGDGKVVELKTYPSPLQHDIPIWLTAAGNPATFAKAGQLGANLLTHMYNQSVDELAEKIRIYRNARADHGYNPATGKVSVMLHTYIGADMDTVRAQVMGPFSHYLRSASSLIGAIAYSRGQQVDFSHLSEEDLQDYLLLVSDRLISQQRVLFGTPQTCAPLVAQLQAVGVDEIACQMDFGIDTDLVLKSLPYLNQLKELSNRMGIREDGPREMMQKEDIHGMTCEISRQTPSAHREQLRENRSRRERLFSQLRVLLGSRLSLNPTTIAGNIPFLEMGADSLVLIDAVRMIEQTFGIKLAMRQFFEELSTLDALVDYLDRILPPDSVGTGFTPVRPDPASAEVIGSQRTGVNPVPTQFSLQQPVPFVSNGVSRGTDGGSRGEKETGSSPTSLQPQVTSEVERVLTHQLEVMSQQIDLLRSQYPPTLQHPQTDRGNEENQTSHPTQTPYVPYQPIRPTGNGILSTRQQHYLEQLVARLTRRTQASKEYAQTYRPVLADNRASAGFRFSIKEMLYPIVAGKSEGAYFWDIDGNRYLDITMGFGVNLLGHNVPLIRQALMRELEAGIQLGPQSRLAGSVARLIHELTGMQRVVFCNSGTEAVMTALRLARAVTGKNKIVLFSGSYHGTFDGVLARSQAENESASLPLAPGVPQKMMDDVLVLEYGSPHSIAIMQNHIHELAAVLVEPVQSRHPDVQPREFLQQLRKLTREASVALIFDETITGFRVHPAGAQAWFDVKADLVIYGKVVGGGMPIGVVAGSAQYMDALDGGMWQYGDRSFPQAETTFFAGTFCKHPLAMASAYAVLDYLKRQGPALQEELNTKTARLAATLNAFFQEEDVPISCLHFGSLFRFAFPQNMDPFYYTLLDKGVYIWEGRNCFLSTAHTDTDIATLIKHVKDTIHEMHAGDFFPEGPAGSGLVPIGEASSPLQNGVVPVNLPTCSGELASPTSPTPSETGIRSFPLTAAQQDFWTAAQLDKEGGFNAYVETLVLQLDGELVLPAMQSALQGVVHRHEALRTVISPQGDQQQVLPELQISVSFQDISSFISDERERLTSRWLNEASYAGLDLTHGPLVGLSILKLEVQRHLLLFAAHYIIAEGWSIALVLQEIAQLYSAHVQQRPCELPSPLQFREYVYWQEQQAQQGAFLADERFWIAKLAEPFPRLELPLDHPRSPYKTFSGARINIPLATDFQQALRKLAIQEGCTLYMVMLAAYLLWLHRICGQEDIVVGVPTAGRICEGSENLVGHVMNLLPLHSVLVGNPTFLEYLHSIKQNLLELYEHQSYPVAALEKKLNPRGLPYAINTTFNLDHPTFLDRFGSDIKVEYLLSPVHYVKLDISILLTLIHANLHFDVHYNRDLFETKTIHRLVQHLLTLMESISQHPDVSVWQQSLLTNSELTQLLVEWNAAQAGKERSKVREIPEMSPQTPLQEQLAISPQEMTLHRLFEQQVEQTPDAVAVVFEESSLTYQELNRRANQLTHCLRKLGIGPDRLVGVCMERSLEMVIALLAVLKAGGAYVPLDPSYPVERLAKLFMETKPVVVLTQSHLTAALPTNLLGSAQQVPLICLETDWEHIIQEPSFNPTSQVLPENLAYVIYTSGSTGSPKGVMNSQQGICNNLLWCQQTYQLTQEDCLLHRTSLSFDPSLQEIFWPLIAGARVVIARPEKYLESSYLVSLLTQEAVTVLKVVPSVLHLLISEGGGWSSYQNVRLVICGGETLSQELQKQFFASHRTGLQNHYGPTEAAINVTSWSCQLESGDQDKPASGIPIGCPIANTQIYLLDRHMQPVPIGVTGELYIGGVNLARGYLNRADLTAERFVPHPFIGAEMGPASVSAAGARLYRTGDLARYRVDGAIEYLGRIDNQVKIRGFRVEPGEIESVLRHYEAVQDVVVVIQQDGMGEQRLVAYLLTSQELSRDALRTFLLQRLPDYMVPAFFVPLAAFPLTPNGKIDRRALPAPDLAQVAHHGEIVAPQTTTEELLVAIWSELLGISQVSRDENFFVLGGHSLLATRLLFRVKETFQVELPLRAIFEVSTLAALAQIIDKQRAGTTTSTVLTQDRAWCEDAILDSTIGRKEAQVPVISQPVSPAGIFLTGATGFLGVHLLYELLQKTQATIYCLVRASSLEQGRQKLYQQLAIQQLREGSIDETRIVPVPGDLALPLFGLSEQQFSELAEQIELIYHTGAMVHGIASYANLKATNVLGTQEVLRLACTGTIKPVHHISTLDVLALLPRVDDKIIDESVSLDERRDYLVDGYPQSKWVAEKLVQQAHERGIPTCVYRVGRIGGHTVSGAWNPDDYLCRLIRGAIQLGCVPDLEHFVDVTPVDYMSEAIVHLSQCSAEQGKIFHLFNPNPATLSDLIDYERSFGYQLERVMYEEWRETVWRSIQEMPEHVLAPLLPYLPEKRLPDQLNEGGYPALLTMTNTREGLTDMERAYPSVNEQLIRTYMSYLVRSGFLPSPPL